MGDLPAIYHLANSGAGKSTARWIVPPEPFLAPTVFAFRLKFKLATKTRIRFHVTADERYILFLDGQRIGRGPERGDARNWFYHTHDFDLAAGDHVLVAQVWAMGSQAPLAQVSVRPGFLLVAEGKFATQLSTNLAPWEVKRLDGFRFQDNGGRLAEFYAVGADLEIDGALVPWGFERGNGSGWKRAVTGEALVPAIDPYGHPGAGHRLRPGLLPPMLDQPIRPGTIRHTEQLHVSADLKKPVFLARNNVAASQAWEKLLRHSRPVRLPARTHWRVVIDLQDYYCAYPQLRVSGGKGSRITLRWAESLYENTMIIRKGNRNEIEGKYFAGPADVFLSDGGKNRLFETLWWRAGRYLQLEIEVGSRPLNIDDFHLRETRYPLETQSCFDSNEPRLASANRIALRTLQMCTHETYMDCPYYEQLMYVGDTRLELLAHYVTSRDDRLPRKALEMFDLSRDGTGLTGSRYPGRDRQVIPPFSLWWIACLHDYARWRGDRSFVHERMEGVRAVINAWFGFRNRRGLIEAPPGWNFTDWVPQWERGMAPTGSDGISSPLNWQIVLVLGLVAELEAWCGEPELGRLALRQASELARKTSALFWNSRRGLFADDSEHRHFSEHAQCLAVLGGQITSTQRRALKQNLPKARGLASCTIYFTHYMLEACRELGLEKMWFKRLQPWFELEKQGFKTVYESPDPCRSDCHAWGSHPLFHSQASILGIRPVGLGFHSVHIAPALGPLREASGTLVHQKGTIRARFIRQGDQIQAEIELPRRVSGLLTWNGKKRKLAAGTKTVCML